MPARPAASRAAVVDIHDDADAEYSARAGEEVDRYRVGVKRGLEVLLAEQELRMRMNYSDLERWLQEGEHLTFHTTGFTNGRDDVDARCAVEHEMMGVPLDAPEEDRPHYGYVRGSFEEATELKNYGNVVVRLGDEVRETATVVLGDSMGSSTTNQGIPGGWICMVAEPLADVGELLCRYPRQDVAGTDQLHKACDQDYQYAEVQIYCPLKPDAIRQVVFCNGEKAPREVRNLVVGDWGIDLDEIDGVLD